jgi:hypothetical protein
MHLPRSPLYLVRLKLNLTQRSTLRTPKILPATTCSAGTQIPTLLMLPVMHRKNQFLKYLSTARLCHDTPSPTYASVPPAYPGTTCTNILAKSTLPCVSRSFRTYRANTPTPYPQASHSFRHRLPPTLPTPITLLSPMLTPRHSLRIRVPAVRVWTLPRSIPEVMVTWLTHCIGSRLPSLCLSYRLNPLHVRYCTSFLVTPPSYPFR